MLPTSMALEVFLRGFSATRSFTKPSEVTQPAEGIWLLADIPGAGDPRRPELITYGRDPESVVRALAHTTLARHALCALIDDDRPDQRAVAAYKSQGYRYMGSEPMFVLELDRRAFFAGADVRRVTTPAEANAVAAAARRRQILPAHLGEDDRPCRLYSAYEKETPVGWVRSIRTHDDCAWVPNMFVQPECRRRELGKALMSAMLEEDARFGVQWSVLLASSAGALLYPRLGYRLQGALLIFTPNRSRRSRSRRPVCPTSICNRGRNQPGEHRSSCRQRAAPVAGWE